MAGLTFDWLAAANEPVTGIEWPQWLKAKKQAAAESLRTLDAPHRKLELWRYSDASRLNKTELEPSNQHKEIDFDEAAVVIKLTATGFDTQQSLPDWLSIKSIQQMPQTQWLDVEMQGGLANELVMQSMNQALFTHGVAVTVNAQAPKNAQIVFCYDIDEANQWTYLRNVIHLEADAKVMLDEQFVSGRLNVVNSFQLSANARLTRHQQSVLTSGQQQVSFQHFNLAEGAYVETQNRHESGDLQHHIQWVDFTAEQAEYRSGSVNKASGGSHIADIVLVNHRLKNNISNVIHRSLADDTAQIFNNAKAVVAKGADGSEISQNLKNILLSDGAKIASKPELEVYADEVIAAHGSTIGALDEGILFFLRSRGIEKQQAKAMMMVSFEEEAVIC